MKKHTKGKVVSVNESLVGAVITEGAVMNGEVAYIIIEDGTRLKSEVIDVKSGEIVYLQVFEDTSWMKVSDTVEFTGLPLAAKLGPGILGTVTDGLQNPLYDLAEIEWFLERGLEVEPLDNTQKWHFTPTVRKGDVVTGGSVLGFVPEKIFKHKIFVPFTIQGKHTVESIVGEGQYTIDEDIAVIKDAVGQALTLQMAFDWPVKKAHAFP
jgi:V/A-type H+-transporting ATPase subunit A